METVITEMRCSGKLRSRPTRLRSDDGCTVVVGTLCYVAESDIAAFAEERKLPITPCDLCGSQENLQRKRVKALLTQLESEHPGVRASLLGAMGNVMPEHLLDPRLVRDERGADPWIDEEPAGLVPLRV